MIGYSGAPRFAQLVGALTGDTEIVPPGLTLESDRPEYSYVKRERLWVVRATLGASIGNFDDFVLFCGGGVDSISVLTHLVSSQNCSIGLPAAAVASASPQPVRMRDARGLFGRKGNTILGTAQPAASSLDTNGQIELFANILYGPGQLPTFITASARDKVTGATFPSIVIESATTNVGMDLFLCGYERTANVEELGLS